MGIDVLPPDVSYNGLTSRSGVAADTPSSAIRTAANYTSMPEDSYPLRHGRD